VRESLVYLGKHRRHQAAFPGRLIEVRRRRARRTIGTPRPMLPRRWRCGCALVGAKCRGEVRLASRASDRKAGRETGGAFRGNYVRRGERDRAPTVGSNISWYSCPHGPRHFFRPVRVRRAARTVASSARTPGSWYNCATGAAIRMAWTGRPGTTRIGAIVRGI
jgi:hypothetical protein